MKRLIKSIIILLSMLLTVTGLYAGDVSVSGYYKMFFTGLKLPVLNVGNAQQNKPAMGSVNNRLRLKLSWDAASWLSFQGSYDFSPRIQDPALFEGDVFFSGIDAGGYRVEDFPQRLYPGENAAVSSFGVFHNLDRFFLTVKAPFADIFIGRQAIAWGSAKFFNPTDVIAPFSFNELDTEERKGVDAVRVRVPLGMMDELDFGYIAGRDFEWQHSAFFLRGKFYLFKTDLSVLLMGFRENLLVGLDIARSIGGAGFWFEAAYVKPAFFETETRIGSPEEPAYVRASVGMDYNFSGNIYGFFEYHFNGAGETKSEDYRQVFMSTAYREAAAYLMGRHYMNVGMTYQLTPLIPVTGLVILNLTDGSFTFAPSLEYNIAENIYLAVGAYMGVGKNPEILEGVSGNPLEPGFRSEFGAYPGMIYTSFRVYF